MPTPPKHKSLLQIDGDLSVKTGATWRRFRRQLLNGDASTGTFQVEKLDDGLLRYSNSIARDDLLSILKLGQSALPRDILKQDLKRSIFRVWLGERSFVLKEYHRLHRWLSFSPDCKGWLGAQRLNNGVACHAWYRRHDLSHAIIVYDDAGELDMYMPKCLQSPPELLNELFRQAGTTIALLHRQNIFHADTKPGNFVYPEKHPHPQVKLIDTDDIRYYWQLSKKRRARNLAQFIGCTRPEFKQLYITAWKTFFQGYLQESATSTKELLAMLPALRKSLCSLYPERESLNRQLLPQLEEQLAASTKENAAK
jgi:tRNA A-37 threonylcarbamoyl transferase component Bud32